MACSGMLAGQIGEDVGQSNRLSIFDQHSAQSQGETAIWDLCLHCFGCDVLQIQVGPWVYCVCCFTLSMFEICVVDVIFQGLDLGIWGNTTNSIMAENLAWSTKCRSMPLVIKGLSLVFGKQWLVQLYCSIPFFELSLGQYCFQLLWGRCNLKKGNCLRFLRHFISVGSLTLDQCLIIWSSGDEPPWLHWDHLGHPWESSHGGEDSWTKRLKRNEENNVAISLAEIFMMICQESITRYERVFNEKHFNCSGVCAQPGIIALLAWLLWFLASLKLLGCTSMHVKISEPFSQTQTSYMFFSFELFMFEKQFWQQRFAVWLWLEKSFALAKMSGSWLHLLGQHWVHQQGPSQGHQCHDAAVLWTFSPSVPFLMEMKLCKLSFFFAVLQLFFITATAWPTASCFTWCLACHNSIE